MSLEDERLELNVVYQAALIKIDSLETYQAAMEEYCEALEQLVWDYDKLLLINPLNMIPESQQMLAQATSQKWYTRMRELQQRKRELLHELPDTPG